MCTRKIIVLLLTVMLLAAAEAQSQRFVINDDEYADKVEHSCKRLLETHKLVSLNTLRRQVRLKGCAVKLPPCAHQKLSPSEIYDRLRASTLAVGSYYKCPDCGGWHFNAGAGFVVADGGVVSTCCHVVLPDDEEIKESYLVAADAAGRVFPVQSVLAADLDADTCLIKIDAPLQALPLRSGVRVGEPVFCLSHPGGYYFMFTQGMVSRVNERRDEAVDDQGQTNGLLTRPILMLNVTSEFAPGSSGAPIADEDGNVVGQVSSIAEASEVDAGDENTPASPSVPVRFCTATEEILGLTDPKLELKAGTRFPRARPVKPHRVTPPSSPAAK